MTKGGDVVQEHHVARAGHGPDVGRAVDQRSAPAPGEEGERRRAPKRGPRVRQAARGRATT